MEDLINVIIDIIELISGFLFPVGNKNDESLPPMRGEPFILLGILILSSLLAFILHSVIKIDEKLYITLSIFFVIMLTMIIFALIRKIYYTLLFNRLKSEKIHHTLK
jgi:hypothetical protein